LPLLQMQVKAPQPSTLTFSATWVSNARFTHAAETGNHGSAIRLLRKLVLNRSEQIVRLIAGKFMKTPRE